MESKKTFLPALGFSMKGSLLDFDLDLVDPAIAIANSYSVPRKLNMEQMVESIPVIQKYFAVEAASIASYDPGII
ncbi:MAG: hypothetical protein ACJ749_02165 [Flavisolibacter sp.]